MSVRRATGPAWRAHLLDARAVTGSVASGIGAIGGTALGAGSSGLSLFDGDGRDLRRWAWADVEGWHAGDCAPDIDGVDRQVLTVEARPAPFVVLADAHQLPRFLSGLAETRSAARHRAARRRRRGAIRRMTTAAACVALALGAAGVAWSQFGSSRTHPPTAHPARGALASSFGGRDVHLAKATTPPVPAPAALAAAPLAAHEAFGFLPYWELANPGDVDLSSLTTVAYFSVDVTAAGAVDESPSNPGWEGYQSQALADLVSEAHRDGARAVLSATCFDQAALDQLTHDPAAQATLAATLVTLVRAKNLDGVNLDFEGSGNADRAGLDQLVATVSQALHGVDPSWQFTVDTYASSASDAGGFYDVAGMAHDVDAFVVMDYSMGDTYAAGPTGGSVYSDQRVVSSYSAAVGAREVILGMPLYGEQWPTTGPTAGDRATGPATAVADDQVSPSDTVFWDPTTDGPWAVYRQGRQWYQVWFNDSASLAAKARLATAAGLRGTAVWALGMAAGTDDQEAAFTGVSVVAQPPDGPVAASGGGMPGYLSPTGGAPLPGTPSLATSPDAPAGAAPGAGGSAGGDVAGPPEASGVYDGTSVTLVPWSGDVPSATTPAGSLSAFASPGTSVACLANGASLTVAQIDGTSAYVVAASSPAQCASGAWAFVLPAAGGASTASSGGSGTGSGQGADGASTATSTTTSTTEPPRANG
ncbi:MAG: glycosyl hydrolase family 18 protein [Acidimicrobiales bacterium]